MHIDFWHERWKLKQIGFHQQGINAHLQEFWGRIEMGSPGRVFVPLSGKSRDMLWLRGEGHEVLGVEVSPVAVREFFEENDLTPSISRQGAFERWEYDGLVLLLGDFFALEKTDLNGVTGVYDRASLVALPPAMRAAYARHMSGILKHDCRLLLVSMEYPEQDMQGPPFPVSEAEIRQLYAKRFDVERIFEADLLKENDRLRKRGLTRLVEKVFLLHPRAA